ncbi:MAG TPA: hypothetical protein VF136_05560 [Methylomirabilota bacterium]
MGDEALVGALTRILVYILVLLAAFVVVYLLLHRLTREERVGRRRSSSRAGATSQPRRHEGSKARRATESPTQPDVTDR